MKRILFLLLAVITAFSVHCQTPLEEGDRYFDSGDYTCAKNKYQQAYQTASGKDKQIADAKLTRAEWCVQYLQQANRAFTNKNYQTAKENYQYVLDSNPKDTYARARLKNCEDMLLALATTLTLSKENLNFSPSGGKENITVTTNATTFSVSNLPSWYTIEKFAGHFVLTCGTNTGTTARTHLITVTAGEKTAQVRVTQDVAKKEEATTLSVTENSLSFPASGGKSQNITVYSNASTYSVSLVPDWCSVEMYSGYFVVTCRANTGAARTDWFRVKANDKEVRVNVKQAAGVKKPDATFEQVWVVHNVWENPYNMYSRKGMQIHIKFSVQGMLKKRGDCVVWFSFSNGIALKDYNGAYRTSDGQVAASGKFTPGYENSIYNDFVIFMPYDELHLTRGFHNLKFEIGLFDHNGRQMATSGETFFSYSW